MREMLFRVCQIAENICDGHIKEEEANMKLVVCDVCEDKTAHAGYIDLNEEAVYIDLCAKHAFELLRAISQYASNSEVVTCFRSFKLRNNVK